MDETWTRRTGGMPAVDLKSTTGARDLEHAAQEATVQLYLGWAPEAVLVRVYASIPFDLAPPSRQRFAQKIAGAATLGGRVPLFCLMGSRGTEPAWSDTRRSKGHYAIPLASQEFVESLPMLSALFTTLGSPLAPKGRDEGSVRRLMASSADAIFHVDAPTARDSKGRRVIPANDFVSQHGIRSVLGSGGLFSDGTFLATIAFFNVPLEPKVAHKMALAVAALRTELSKLVFARLLFPPDSD